MVCNSRPYVNGGLVKPLIKTVGVSTYPCLKLSWSQLVRHLWTKLPLNQDGCYIADDAYKAFLELQKLYSTEYFLLGVPRCSLVMPYGDLDHGQ